MMRSQAQSARGGDLFAELSADEESSEEETESEDEGEFVFRFENSFFNLRC